MSLSLLLDENIEHEAIHRLANYGHDVEHIDLHEALRKGDPDRRLAGYSPATERIIVSYDTDWVTEFSKDEHHCALVVDDQSLSARQVAQIVHNMGEAFPSLSLSVSRRLAVLGSDAPLVDATKHTLQRWMDSATDELEAEANERGVSRSEHISDAVESREDTAGLRERPESREERIDKLEAQLGWRSQL